MTNLIANAIAGGREARARLLAASNAPGEPPFPGAVAVVCTDCGKFLIWAMPPVPDTLVACWDHDGPGRVVVEPPPTT